MSEPATTPLSSSLSAPEEGDSLTTADETAAILSRRTSPPPAHAPRSCSAEKVAVISTHDLHSPKKLPGHYLDQLPAAAAHTRPLMLSHDPKFPKHIVLPPRSPKAPKRTLPRRYAQAAAAAAAAKPPPPLQELLFVRRFTLPNMGVAGGARDLKCSPQRLFSSSGKVATSSTLEEIRRLQRIRHGNDVVRRQHRTVIKQVAFIMSLVILATMYAVCRGDSAECYHVQLIGLVGVCFITSATYFLLRHARFKRISPHVIMASTALVVARYRLPRGVIV